MVTNSDDPFLPALASALAPLAAAMVARGVTLGEATEVLKRALVQAVIEQDGGCVSDSRVSLRTGLHRKDVKRLREPDPVAPKRKSGNAASLAVSHWSQSPRFCTPKGEPRDLPRVGDTDNPGFDDLIRSARIDMAPGTVLAALLEQGMVADRPDGTFRLLKLSFVPSTGSDAQVAAYQATISAHLTAATQNLTASADAPRHFDRVVRYSHLSQESVDHLSTEAAKKAQALLEEINRMAQEYQYRDRDQSGNNRFAFGAYILSPHPTTEGSE